MVRSSVLHRSRQILVVHQRRCLTATKRHVNVKTVHERREMGLLRKHATELLRGVPAHRRRLCGVQHHPIAASLGLLAEKHGRRIATAIISRCRSGGRQALVAVDRLGPLDLRLERRRGLVASGLGLGLGVLVPTGKVTEEAATFLDPPNIHY